MYLTWTCIFGDLEGKEVVGTFYEKELQKTKENPKRDKSWKNNKEKRW